MGISDGESLELQLTGVTKVEENDIICGRGGLALKHPGNMAYRKIVGLNKELYASEYLFCVGSCDCTPPR